MAMGEGEGQWGRGKAVGDRDRALGEGGEL